MSDKEYQREWVSKNKDKWTAYNSAWMRDKRIQRKAEGICVVCGARKARFERVTCEVCAERAKKIVKP